jgi:multiple sugar transport system permease protein
MNQISTLERIIRGVLIALVLVFFLFPIFWILLMSFQNNDQILRIPPSLFFEPTLQNYTALLTGRLETTAGNLDIAFMRNLGNSSAVDLLGPSGAGAGCAGGLCLRAL